MLSLPAGVRIWLVAGFTDMRRGIDGLAALVQTALSSNGPTHCPETYTSFAAAGVIELNCSGMTRTECVFSTSDCTEVALCGRPPVTGWLN